MTRATIDNSDAILMSSSSTNNDVEMVVPMNTEAWVLRNFETMFQNIKSNTPIEIRDRDLLPFRERVKILLSDAWAYTRENPKTVGFYAGTLIISGFVAYMYVLPGYQLAKNGHSSGIWYILDQGGTVANFVEPIVFGAASFNTITDRLWPLPGLAELRTRQHSKARAYTGAILSSTFGCLSAFLFAVLQYTDGGLTPFNIFATFMVLLGNTLINSIAFTDLIYMPQVLLPFLVFLWTSLTSLCRNSTPDSKEIAATAKNELLLLSRKVLENGAWRIEDFLFKNFDRLTSDYESNAAYFKREYPHFRKVDFATLKSVYNRIRLGEVDHATLKDVMQLEINIASDVQPQAKPHSIRVGFGWPGGNLGLLSTLGYFALIYLAATSGLGDNGGYTSATIFSLGFIFLVWAVGLVSIENYANLGYDGTRISCQKIYSVVKATPPSTVPSYKELFPISLRAYPIATLILGFFFFGCAAFSFQASVELILTKLPDFLVKLFGGIAADYAALAQQLVIPTIIGAFAFNSYPMGNAAQKVILGTAKTLRRLSPAMDSHKATVIAVAEELNATISSTFTANPTYVHQLIQDVTTLEKSSHDLDEENAEESAKPAPFTIYAQNLGKHKNAGKEGCGSALLGHLSSFFLGRKIGGSEYAANLEGLEFGEEQGLLSNSNN